MGQRGHGTSRGLYFFFFMETKTKIIKLETGFSVHHRIVRAVKRVQFVSDRILYMRFVQKVSGLTTVHEVDKAYRVLTLIAFNIVPFCSYTLRPLLLPLLETFCKLLFRDV